jgi:hypothetical protein
MDFTIYQEKKCTLKCSTKGYSGSSEASTLFQLRCVYIYIPNHSHVNDHCNEKQFTCKKIMPNQLFFSFLTVSLNLTWWLNLKPSTFIYINLNFKLNYIKVVLKWLGWHMS